MTLNKNLKQIGIMGSMADKKISGKLITVAKEIGREIANKQATLLFGFEGDYSSLPVIAAKNCELSGGQTIAFLWGNQKTMDGLSSKRIVTGQLRGGGREFSLILSCDVIICLSGGSGTLMEIAMAYQANIPIIVVKDSGGWSTKLANKFLDDRKREKIIGVNGAKEAVNMAMKLAVAR